MIDPGALGTLLIGLDHVRDAHDAPGRPPAARPVRTRRDRRLARGLAASLRWLANVIEPAQRPRDLGLEG